MLQGSEARENGAQQPVQPQGPGQVCCSACLPHAVCSGCTSTAQSQWFLHGMSEGVCICVPMLVVGRSDWRQHAEQVAARQRRTGDLQVFSAYLVPSSEK